MSVGPGAFSVFTASMTSGATLTSLIDLGHSWSTVYLGIPSMVSGTDIYIQAGFSSAAVGGPRLMHPAVNTSSVQANTFVIGSAISSRVVPIPNGIRYLFIEYSSATTATSQVFKLFCGK